MNLPHCNQLSDKLVYQVTRDIFVGPKAEFRRLAVVRKCIESHQRKHSRLQDVVGTHGIDPVCQTVQKLLNDGMFDSTLRASERFPDLFSLSADHTAARDALEVEAIKKEESAIQSIVGFQLNGSQTLVDWGEVTTSTRETADDVPDKVDVCSLFPIYLAFSTEHKLMVLMQKTLEYACYDFGQQALPDLLRRRGWDCPESVELNRWTEVLRQEKLTDLTKTGKFPEGLLRSIAKISHTAVHRLRTTSRGLEQFLVDAEDFVAMMGGTVYPNEISKLRTEVQSVVSELAQNKQFLQLQLEEIRATIARRRAELDVEEQEAIAYIKSEDQKYQRLAGKKLESTIGLMGEAIAAVN